ncbi:MAG: DUF521 domain-containing protein [Euryarchaeota archaeon]|nr:DUF521 domain-containing protein [Euryarchaeota archaeon]
MFLTREEEAILRGEAGPGAKRCMELLVAIGTVYDAERLVPISSAHLSGVSYKTIGDGGLSFLLEIAEDARVRVGTTLNPAGMDRRRWREMGVPEAFAQKQLEIIDCYGRIGVETGCTCTPYLAGNLPTRGDTVAWAESSALSFVNSVVGARTNREGGPGALAAAIVGKTPCYGLHLDENRRPTVVIEADVGDSLLDHSLLGHVIGKRVSNAVPYIRGVKPSPDDLKILAAAMAASGSVAMFHVEGVTPGAGELEVKGLEKVQVDRREIATAKESLSTGKDPDLIALGCPHLSEAEMKELASLLKGKRKKGDVEVWFCTSGYAKGRCPKEVGVLEKFGKVLCDTCMIVSPIETSFSCTATNSAKACTYLPTLCSQKVVCDSAERLLELIT